MAHDQAHEVASFRATRFVLRSRSATRRLPARDESPKTPLKERSRSGETRKTRIETPHESQRTQVTKSFAEGSKSPVSSSHRRRDSVRGHVAWSAMRPLLFLGLVAYSAVPLTGRADAISMPASCPTGARPVPNESHGSGWCAPAPCATNDDCDGVNEWGGAPGPYVCQTARLCVGTDGRHALGVCETVGDACTNEDQAPGTCLERPYCVPASSVPDGTNTGCAGCAATSDPKPRWLLGFAVTLLLLRRHAFD